MQVTVPEQGRLWGPAKKAQPHCLPELGARSDLPAPRGGETGAPRSQADSEIKVRVRVSLRLLEGAHAWHLRHPRLHSSIHRLRTNRED